MATARTDAAFARAVAFERAAHELIAGRITPLPYGFATADDALALVYYANAVWVTADRPVDCATLMRDADRVLAAVEHRCVIVEHETAWAPMAGAFRAAGWDVEVLLWMVHRGGAPDRPDGVREVTRAELVAAEDAFLAGEGRSPDVRRQLLAKSARIGDALGERYFAAFAGKDIAGYAKLRARDGVAQVEDVTVLAQHRGHGYGRAVTAAATRAALACDPDLLFLIAADDDWPKQLYARLGYEPVGRSANFVRPAPNVPRSPL